MGDLGFLVVGIAFFEGDGFGTADSLPFTRLTLGGDFGDLAGELEALF